MAIDTTRGLPSFSEMYQAFKNRGNIGQAIDAGVGGFFDEKAALAKQNLEKAQAENQSAEAKYHLSQANGTNEKKVPLAALPEEAKAALASYADAQGNIPEAAAKVFLSTTAQGQAAEKAANELTQRQKDLEQRTAHAKEMEAVNQQLADLKAALGGKAQEINSAQTIANTTKGANPSLLDKLAGKIGEATNIPAIVPDEYTRAKQFSAATQKLSETAGISPTSPSAPQVTPSVESLMTHPATPAPTKKANPGKPVAIYTEDDYNNLPVGKAFIDGSGKVKIKGQ